MSGPDDRHYGGFDPSDYVFSENEDGTVRSWEIFQTWEEANKARDRFKTMPFIVPVHGDFHRAHRGSGLSRTGAKLLGRKG